MLDNSPASSSPGTPRSTTKQRDIVVLGARGVGKSATVIQYVEDHFVDVYNPTIESTFRKAVRWRGEDVVLAIRDTTGQDEGTIFHPRNCAGVHGYIIVYSVTSRQSFRIAEFIHDKLLVNLMGSTSVPLVLLGNKNDLEVEREVSAREGRALARSWGVPFLECSAKHNENVGEAFSKLLMAIQKDEGEAPVSEPTCCDSPWCMGSMQAVNDEQQHCLLLLLKVFTVAIMMLGLAYLTAGVFFGVQESKVAGGHQALCVAILVVGVLLVLVSIMGIWGANAMHVTTLKAFCAAMTVMIVAQFATSVMVLTASRPTLTAVVRARAGVWLVATVTTVCQVITLGLGVCSYRMARSYAQALPAFQFHSHNSWNRRHVQRPSPSPAASSTRSLSSGRPSGAAAGIGRAQYVQGGGGGGGYGYGYGSGVHHGGAHGAARPLLDA